MHNLMQQWLLGAVRLVLGAHGRYMGTPPTARQTIYFANHSSHADTLAILAALPPDLRAKVRPAAARDYWDTTPLRRFVANRVLNVVYVTRHAAAGEDPLESVREALASGSSIIIFPEGLRNQSGEIGPFKSGLYWLSREFPGVSVVPVYLSGLLRAMPKGRLLPVPINCQVAFGDAIPGASAFEKNEFIEMARIVRLMRARTGTSAWRVAAARCPCLIARCDSKRYAPVVQADNTSTRPARPFAPPTLRAESPCASKASVASMPTNSSRCRRLPGESNGLRSKTHLAYVISAACSITPWSVAAL